MNDIIHYSNLYDFYKNMLTVKQKETFQDYFFDNLSIEEIAINNGVSKNAISKTLKTIKNDLDEYESKLHFQKYYNSIKDEFKNDELILKKLDKYDSIILD